MIKVFTITTTFVAIVIAILFVLTPVASANHCGPDEFHTPTNTCEDDNESPVLLVEGTRGDRTLDILVGETYREPPYTATDNDPNYSRYDVTVTTTPGPVDTSRPGTFIVEYRADSDNAGNGDRLVILVTVIVSCPTGEIFAIRNICRHPLDFGGDDKVTSNDGLILYLVASGVNASALAIFVDGPGNTEAKTDRLTALENRLETDMTLDLGGDDEVTNNDGLILYLIASGVNASALAIFVDGPGDAETKIDRLAALQTRIAAVDGGS